MAITGKYRTLYARKLAAGICIAIAGTAVLGCNRNSSSNAEAKQKTSQAAPQVSLQELNERYNFEVDEYKKLSDRAVESITKYCKFVDTNIELNALSVANKNKQSAEVAKEAWGATEDFRLRMNKDIAALDEQNKRVESAAGKIRQQTKPIDGEQARFSYKFEQLESLRLTMLPIKIDALKTGFERIRTGRAGALSILQEANPDFVKTVLDEIAAGDDSLNSVLGKVKTQFSNQNIRVEAALATVRELEAK